MVSTCGVATVSPAKIMQSLLPRGRLAVATTTVILDCHSAAPPSSKYRCFNMDGEGMSVK